MIRAPSERLTQSLRPMLQFKYKKTPRNKKIEDGEGKGFEGRDDKGGGGGVGVKSLPRARNPSRQNRRNPSPPNQDNEDTARCDAVHKSSR